MKFLSKLGKSLMLPVCVLPICGILMGIGYALCPASMQGGEISGFINTLGYLLVKAGGAIIDNMSILFVIGVAIGMSDDGHGTAALAGIASWLVITNLLSVNVMNTVFGGLEENSSTYIAFTKIQNPTVGMISGLIGAFCYNKFKSTKLPDFLAFFSGKRSVAIVTVLFSLVVAAVLALVWPACFGAMVKFGSWIASLGGVGVGIYTFLNRLLIPTGMHHALNNVFWFDTIGLGDLNNFWAGKISEDVGWSLGMYMSGFFPCMMGGIAGAALAIYKCSKDKKKAAGVLFSSALCAFLCGLTEPFEFSFMFICFPLYVLYSALYGIFATITYYTGFRAGFSFSAGLIDLVFSSTLPAAQKTLLVIPLIAAAFLVFYLVFYFTIKKFHVSLFAQDDSEDLLRITDDDCPGNDDLSKARGLLKAVGGRDNVVSCDCCATRLRLDVIDSSLADKALAKKYGAVDVICPGKNTCQVIIGLNVQQVLDSFKKVLSEEEKDDSNKSGNSSSPFSMTVTGKKVLHGETLYIPIKKDRQMPRNTCPSNSDIPLKTEDDGTITFTYIIKDPSGIHARPAGKIAQTVKSRSAFVTLEAKGKSASGSSVVEMMELGINKGDEITVRVDGNSGDALDTANELGCFISENL